MRTAFVLLVAPLLVNARQCSSEPPAQPIAAASVSVASAPIASKHGGTVVTAGDVQLELVVKGDGEVTAYPVQAAASAPATLTADAQVTVQVPVESGGTRPVQLVYVPGSARFEGHVRGARVVTQPTDVEVVVVSRGRSHRGRASRYVVAPAAVVVEPAQVRMRGPAVVVQPAPTVIVQQPVARVDVQMPRVDVRIGGPAVRGVVVVDDDRHHDEGRGHHDNGLHLGHGDGRGGGRGHGGGHGGGRHH